MGSGNDPFQADVAGPLVGAGSPLRAAGDSPTDPRLAVPEPVPLDVAEGPQGDGAVALAAAMSQADSDSSAEPPAPPGSPDAAVGTRVVRSVLSLLVREGLLKIIVLAATVVLARILAPSDFGIFVILSFFNTFLATFGSFGLAAAIVQRREDPQRGELGSLFSFQIAIAAALVVIAELVAPPLASAYHLGPSGVWLIRAMALSFLLTSAAATPMALLERRLAFERVAVVDVSAGVLYQALAVGMAVAGFGIWSLVVATLASAAAAALLTYAAAGWWPHLALRSAFRWRAILPLITYGIKFQANSFISLLKDNITPTFVAVVAGAVAVGYINWASTLAYYPIVLVGLIGRVTFPAFSRVAHDRERLQAMVEGAIRIQAYLVFPAVAALAAFAPDITHVVFTDKWQPAVPVLYFMLVSTALSGVTTPLVAGLNALGKPGVVSRLMFMWLILDWGLIVPLVLKFGYVGYGAANAFVALSGIVTVAIYKRQAPVRFVRNLSRPALVGAACCLAFMLLARMFPPTGVALLAAEAVGLCVVFAGLEAVLDPRFLVDARYLVGAVLARRARG